MNRIDKILMDLEAPAPTAATAKTASAASPLDAAIGAALDKIQGTAVKTASADAGASSPVGDLMKLANEVREADQEAEVKLAHRMGSAFTDGMMERLELYRAQAAELDKTASAGDADERAALEKFAAENPAQYAALVREGFFAQMGDYEKQASDEFDAGFMEKAAEIHALAADHFLAGYAALEQALA